MLRYWCNIGLKLWDRGELTLKVIEGYQMSTNKNLPFPKLITDHFYIKILSIHSLHGTIIYCIKNVFSLHIIYYFFSQGQLYVGRSKLAFQVIHTLKGEFLMLWSLDICYTMDSSILFTFLFVIFWFTFLDVFPSQFLFYIKYRVYFYIH